jgi:hypothetical protein
MELRKVDSYMATGDVGMVSTKYVGSDARLTENVCVEFSQVDMYGNPADITWQLVNCGVEMHR